MVIKNLVFNPIFKWLGRISKAEGSYVWDETGKRYIDFISGWNVTNIGWNHPEVTEAIKIQSDKNTYISSWISDPAQEQLAELLISVLPKKLNAICRTTSGTEANEQAIKLARAVTGKKKILGFQPTNHGSTYASISVSYRDDQVPLIAPLVPDFIHLPFLSESDDKKTQNQFYIELEKLLSRKDIAAVLTEPGIITGYGSMKIAPTGFMQKVRKLTQKYNALLILDEVGTGFGRCGTMFAFEQGKIVPDMITLSKAMSNGTGALGACIVNADLIEGKIAQSKVLSTLAWMPLGCAGAKKTLEIHIRDQVWKQAQKKGEWMLQTMRAKIGTHPQVADIRGIGMEIGLEFKKTRIFNFTASVVDSCIKNGLHVIQSDDTIIQMMPALTIPQKVMEEGINILIASIKKNIKS